MGARSLSLLTLMLLSAAAVAQDSEASSEEVLDFFVNGLRTCTFVQEIERQGSLFRIYGTNQSMSEFDIDDMSAPQTASGLSVFHLACDTPGCVRNFLASSQNGGQWTPMPPSNFLVYSCAGGGAAEKMAEAVNYYKSNF